MRLWQTFVAVVSFCLPPALMAGEIKPSQGEPKLAAHEVEFFEARIRPLLVMRCYRCHSRTATKVGGSLLLDTRAGLLKGGASGPAVVPKQPEESLLLKAVRHLAGELRMPPGKKLSTEEIADLETWIRMGAPDPRGEQEKGAKAVGIDWDRARTHWSLQPLKSAALPEVADSAWPISPIDHFVLRRLEERGLVPSPPADARTLLRRVYFDLVGLPPTPTEVENFAAVWSAEPQRRQLELGRVVERLLASPAYGERWGRHWLDVVRYADTAGDNSDYPIPQMIKYRDWVIEAFNRDLPYDEFVRQQLAGDLMPPTDPSRPYDQIIATGYLANSRRHGSYEDARYPWHLTIEDTIDNLGKAFLGMNLGCARCHDHKFDPFTMEDYYGLYGFFSSTRYPWPGIELDKQPRDLVPLAPPAEVEKALKARREALGQLEMKLKQLAAEKAPAATIAAVKNERDQLARRPLPWDTAYAVIDGQNVPKQRIGQVGDVRVQLKGDPENLGALVRRRFPTILGGQVLPPDEKGSGRLHLAKWLTDAANPLFARVMVNRIWLYHFGRGLVATPNDFGKQGQPPSHPELLDYLAQQFITHGWSIKHLHRLIVLSATYQQASSSAAGSPGAGSQAAAAEQIDPDNQLLWRFPRRRLDAEAIRDTILAVSGALDRSRGGPHPFPDPATWDFTQHKPFKAVYPSNRRSVYLMTQRIQRHPFLALFDGPDTNASTAARYVTTTPLQALFLMNDPFVHEHASRLARRLLDECDGDHDRIEWAFLCLFSRPPSERERSQTTEFLSAVGASLRAAGLTEQHSRRAAWESLARVLLMSNEMIYVD
ncbi:MAG: PSD1 and planctomycete cytochrome C domain-containing protein [Gemmataceae bacterium]|nr:PSD1 and planctomycete cytochrome C domain-containing protein [Gemmataceae bacterium]